MYFCRVPFVDFPTTYTGSYALLRLSAEPLVYDNNDKDSTFFFSIHMDSQDGRSSTTKIRSVDYRDSKHLDSERIIAESNVKEFVKVDGNHNLNIDLVIMRSGKTHGENHKIAWPKFGFEYSVFGYHVDQGADPKTGERLPDDLESRGYMDFDTEDNNTADLIMVKYQEPNGGDLKDMGKLQDLLEDPYMKEKLPEKIVEYSKHGLRFYMKKVIPGNIAK